MNVIQFPKPETLDITTMPLQHVRQYVKDNGWKGFAWRKIGDKVEIRRTYR